MGEGYDTGQACMNGHSVTGDASDDFAERFCSKCGAPTITACPSCSAPLRGDYRSSVLIIGGPGWSVADFCYGCGQPYPWTGARLDALRELAGFAENLDEGERQALAASFEDLIRETPRTPAAVARVKVLLAKAGSTTAQAVRSILVDVASAEVKRQLGL